MRGIAIALVLLLQVAMGLAQTPANAPPYRVIVHPSTPIATVDRAFLGEIFLKKITRWRNGEPIYPVDLVDSPVRRRFNEDVLQRSVAAVRSYWQQIVFSGRGLPPPELESEAEVVRYVLRTPGAVGYVSPDVATGGAKVLAVR